MANTTIEKKTNNEKSIQKINTLLRNKEKGSESFSNLQFRLRDVMRKIDGVVNGLRKSVAEKAEIYEGQIMITNGNISSLEKYSVQGREILQAILNESGK